MKWTKAYIKDEILKHVGKYDLDRMPTVSELKSVGRGDLCNAISKNKGFKYWAKKLGLEIKTSETGLGKMFEDRFRKDVAKRFGWETKQMSMRFPYDVLVANTVKVDVKCGFLYKAEQGEYYSFSLGTKDIKADFIVCYCLTDTKSVSKIYVIPAVVLQGQKQISIGLTKSKYDKYLYSFELIAQYISFYEEVKAG